jgi:glycerophosphoryl diester phosphodiesterase
LFLIAPGRSSRAARALFEGRAFAHRGLYELDQSVPENSLPAFLRAVEAGYGAELDVQRTRDGQIVVFHDDDMQRACGVRGAVRDFTYEELKAFDFGAKDARPYHGLRVLKFEDILKKFSCQTIMNIHVKDRHCEGYGEREQKDALREEVQKIADLLYQYDCEQHVYIMNSNPEFMKEFHRIAPHIRRCMGWRPERQWGIVDDAIELGCEKVQFYTTYITKEEVERAHAHGIVCNAFFADTIEDAKRYLDMGIDTILTNDYLTIANTVKAH